MDKFDVTTSRWTPIERMPDRNREQSWWMKCECGVEREVNWKNYCKGKTRSCGCYRHEVLKTREPGRNVLPHGIAARNNLMLVYRRGATKRGYSFDLSIEQFTELTSSNCHFCGRPPNRNHFPVAQGLNGGYQYNGIDRKDNSLGYIFENCLPACTECNKAKNTLTYDEFIAYLDALVAFRNTL